jgi:hypothetical protein
MVEEDASGGKGIELWSLGPLRAAAGRIATGITAQMVSACGVERDQKDIAVR